MIISHIIFAQDLEGYIVNSASLKLRSGPGTTFKEKNQLKKGTKVTLLEKNSDGWWKVRHNKEEGFVLSKHLVLDLLAGWEKQNFKSGEELKCENFQPSYAYEINNYLNIKVGNNTDVVVKLMKINEELGDMCIRIVYIRSSELYSITNIPEGKYYLKIAYGMDWRQKIINNRCIGKFIVNSIYEKGEIMDFNIIKSVVTIGNDKYNKTKIPSFDLELNITTTNKSLVNEFNSNNISEKQFNE